MSSPNKICVSCGDAFPTQVHNSCLRCNLMEICRHILRDKDILIERHAADIETIMVAGLMTALIKRREEIYTLVPKEILEVIHAEFREYLQQFMLANKDILIEGKTLH